MDEIIEGCIALFFSILAILIAIAIPVAIAYCVIYGLFWLAYAVERFIEQNLGLILTIGFLGVFVFVWGVVIAKLIQLWWASHQVKAQQKRALCKLEERYQEAARAMDELGQADAGSAP
ncbi:hypothetical protein LK07_20560 [Streptomyces pluripotens]|uniref:Uncharacterized protein n=1 Tax=Streptomyces pluripotens TaxID=1355015 RepID=A0A221P1H1_9ACTN|nr:hypothetical protein [Streptomyces pluripotens]ARP71749.1 hypothetical protein LK06_019395 [Streptomyces pluripotens]ASN26002.1 hypothetical protein LK07_20560 [Streptomyces pluripotens]